MDAVAQQLEAYFPTYLSMGHARSLAKVALELKLPLLQVTRHAKDYRWSQRLREAQLRDERMLTVSPSGKEKTRVEIVNAEQLDIADKILERVKIALGTLNLEKPRDMLTAIKIATELKRQATGADKTAQEDLARLLLDKWKELNSSEPIKQADVRVIEGDSVIPTPEVDADFQLDPAFLEEPEEMGDEDDQQA